MPFGDGHVKSPLGVVAVVAAVVVAVVAAVVAAVAEQVTWLAQLQLPVFGSKRVPAGQVKW